MGRLIAMSLVLAVSTAHAAQSGTGRPAPTEPTMDSVTCDAIIWAIVEADDRIAEGCPPRTSTRACLAYLADIALNRQRLCEIWQSRMCYLWPK